MSFNVRYAEPGDGPDIWELRRPIVRRMIETYEPDIVGMQEPEIEQLRDMDADLPEYGRFGVSRYGNEFEKFAAVMYRKDRLDLLESGAYWFSETPDQPGSMSWLIHKPYAVNWGRLRDKATGRSFVLHNAQFPYKPEQAEARTQAALLMRDRSEGSEDTILTGDFNCDARGNVYELFRERFKDAIDAPEAVGPRATFHGFTGTPTSEARLDWILFRGALRPTRFETVTYNEGGRFPSDHFPVVAAFEWI